MRNLLVTLANDFHRDTRKAQRLARQIESGGVFIIGMTKSDPRLP
jgi:hypothetical protein